MSHTLNEKALLVQWSTTIWTARRYDRKASEEVAKAHNINADAGRYNKMLIPANAASYKECLQRRNAARTTHYEQTLPWDDEGWRILPSANWIDYTARMRNHNDKIREADDAFFDDYPALKANAPRLLNSLYNPADYPELDDLRKKFSANTRTRPMPDPDSLRRELFNDDATDTEQVREQLRSELELASQNAMRDLYQRLYDATAHIVDRLSDKDAIFRDSMIMNVRELCDILPRLNLTNDAQLETMRQQIELELASWEPEDLRKSKALRAEIARKAAAIQANLAGYMGVQP